MQRQGELLASLVVITVLVIAATVALAPSPARQVGQTGSLRSFDSYAQMKSLISQNGIGSQNRWPGLPGPLFAAASTLSGTSFTTTNIQVEGVDEPDLVKTDGTYLYAASGASVFVSLVYPPDKAGVVSRLDYNGEVIGIFLSQSRLVVIESGPANYSSRIYTQAVNLLLYDVPDASKPTLLRSVSVEGSYVSSRLANGYVYAVLQQPTWRPDGEGNYTVMPPSVISGKVNLSIPPSLVYYNPDSTVPAGMYTIIVSLSLADGSHAEQAVLTGWSATIYSSTSNIYLTFPDRVFYPLMGTRLPSVGGPIIATPVWWGGGGTNTTIFRVAFSGGETQVAAEGTIPGTVLNQFSIDEYQGYLRVATTSYRTVADKPPVQTNNVYVLDQSLKVVGALEGIASHEKIYSVRFLDGMGYVVTFERIDPLFAISFANPTHPAILSELKLTGFSDYLHPLDNGYLIGVGKDAVPAENGNFAWYQGLKLSLFHVDATGTSAEVAKYLIGDRGSDSPVLYDHKAFVYDAGKGLMALPVLVAQVDMSASGGFPPVNAYGKPVWQGAYLFKVSAEGGFNLTGSVTQIPSNGSVQSSYDYYVNRIVIIGDYIYTVSNRMILVNSLSGLSAVGEIQFPR